jgi:hypothetical protein
VIGASRINPPLILVALASVALGLAIPYLDGQALVVVLALAAVPLLLALSISPIALLAVFAFAQILEGYEYNSPVGSLTLGLAALVLLLLMCGKGLREAWLGSSALRVGVGLLLVWVATFPMRTTYEPLSEALRDGLTAASFVAVVLVAAGFAGKRAIRATALGAAAGLLTLGAIALVASLGALPLPSRNEAARVFFGFQMPFRRNYGLPVGYDSIALLAPLPVAYCAVHLRRHWPTLIALTFVFLTVFQARGMVVQVILALVALPILRRPHRMWLLVPLFFVALALVPGDANAEIDISNLGRSVVNAQTVHDASHDPVSFLTGRDQTVYLLTALSRFDPKLVLAYSGLGHVPVHNFFLSNLVAGGWLALLALAGAFVVMLFTAYRDWRNAPGDRASQTLILAAVLVTFEALIEPVIANIVGLWLVMGFVLGLRRDRTAARRRGNHTPALNTSSEDESPSKIPTATTY